MQHHIVVIGGGPAGLTAAYLLAKEKIPVTVLEKDPHYVGGIARTVNYKNYGFDIGGHRFFSKAKEVEDFWTEILPHDMLTQKRISRIFYQNKFYSYPLKLFEVLKNLGLFESFLCFFSYIKIALFPIKNSKSYADWVVSRFGYRLFSIFFKTYTEKVWGMRCEEISSDWAAQRIQNLSFLSALMNALIPKTKSRKKIIKTLIDSFRYPRKGPGMLWDACVSKIKQMGGIIMLDQTVTQCVYDDQEQTWNISHKTSNGELKSIKATHVIYSGALQELITEMLEPKLPAEVHTAASNLHYRDFLIVALIMKDRKLFNDHWIYIHDSSVDVARIQNFKAWSAEMVPDPSMCCYGMEYFCFKDDGLWSMPDKLLIEKAVKEITKIGLARVEDIVDGCVVRNEKAYPVYDEHYKKNVEIIRQGLSLHCPHLYLVGRNGMHKYNNQDHAMMTAMLTVKNILAGKNIFDVWRVNQDAEYIEQGNAGQGSLFTGRSVPQRILEE